MEVSSGLTRTARPCWAMFGTRTPLLGRVGCSHRTRRIVTVVAMKQTPELSVPRAVARVCTAAIAGIAALTMVGSVQHLLHCSIMLTPAIAQSL